MDSLFASLLALTVLSALPAVTIGGFLWWMGRWGRRPLVRMRSARSVRRRRMVLHEAQPERVWCSVGRRQYPRRHVPTHRDGTAYVLLTVWDERGRPLPMHQRLHVN